MEINQILLSICIPTYNRSEILNGNLSRIHNQIKGKNLPIEIIVSDNCSADNTANIVQAHISEGMPINYIRNNENLGMDGNFAQCYRRASGKYILVLGDDDYLRKGKLEKLLDYLSKGEYGLVHLKVASNSTEDIQVFDSSEEFLKNISFWITYITSNIVNSKYVIGHDFEKYFGTYLTIVPLYLTSATSKDKNLLIYDRIFEDGKDSKTNGGYNFFEVFVTNYLSIWKQYARKNKITNILYSYIKYDIFKKYVVDRVIILLILKQKGNFKTKSGWKILMYNYGYCPYFYSSLIHLLCKIFFTRIKRIFKI